jgi:glycosyltransferase involved in cell wall biosynthesis
LITTLDKPETASLRFAGKRVVAAVYSNYPSDPRPRRAAEALVRHGASVEVICLKERDDEPQRETFNGVHITRLPLERRRAGKLSYIYQYGTFILLAGIILAYRTTKKRFDLVHIHNMPDVLVFSALIPKLFGAKVILDLHDPMPELMMAIFDLPETSLAVRLLKTFEKWSLSFAHAVVTANEAFSKIFAGRSCVPEKVTVIMNSPDEEIFSDREASKTPRQEDNSKRFVIMYHGSLVERHGLDLAIKALAMLRDVIPQAELRIFGKRTPYLDQVLAFGRSSGLSEVIQYLGPKNLEQIAIAIRDCDIGIIPNRKSRFTELNMPTRIFEFLSQGKPVIAPRTPGISDYFTPDELLLFELGNAEDLAKKIAYAFRNPEEMVGLIERGQEIYRRHKWSVERLRFVSLVENLLSAAKRSAVHSS